MAATTSATEPPADDKKNETPPVSARFIERLKSTFNTENGTDLTIICGDSRWRVHKALLCQHSTVFEGMLHGKFLEAGATELTLPDDNEHGIKMLLKFMYTFDYVPEHLPLGFYERCKRDLRDGSHLDIRPHMEVIRTADKYDVPELLGIALECFYHDCDNNCGLRAFTEAVEQLYTGEWPEQLREEAVRVVCNNIDWWTDEEYDNQDFWDVVETIPKFLVDVMRYGKPTFPEPESERKRQNAAEAESRRRAAMGAPTRRGNITPMNTLSSGTRQAASSRRQNGNAGGLFNQTLVRIASETEPSRKKRSRLEQS